MGSMRSAVEGRESVNTDPVRLRLRRLASGLTAAISVVYFLIGTGAVTVVVDSGGNPDREVQAAFGFAAGVVFAIGAVVIFYVDRRLLWWLGALCQAFIIYVYFDLSPERTPSFEFWGIAIRAAQIVLIGVLVSLGAGRRASDRRTTS